MARHRSIQLDAVDSLQFGGTEDAPVDGRIHFVVELEWRKVVPTAEEVRHSRFHACTRFDFQIHSSGERMKLVGLGNTLKTEALEVALQRRAPSTDGAIHMQDQHVFAFEPSRVSEFIDHPAQQTHCQVLEPLVGNIPRAVVAHRLDRDVLGGIVVASQHFEAQYNSGQVVFFVGVRAGAVAHVPLDSAKLESEIQREGVNALASRLKLFGLDNSVVAHDCKNRECRFATKVALFDERRKKGADHKNFRSIQKSDVDHRS